MPTYEYSCDECRYLYEEFQGLNEKPLERCPNCDKLSLRRLFGTGGALIVRSRTQLEGRSVCANTQCKIEDMTERLVNGQVD